MCLNKADINSAQVRIWLVSYSELSETYEGVSKSFRTGFLEREQQIV
jgi:hypothetical protein